MGEEQTRLQAGDTIFVPRAVNHAFNCVSEKPGKLMMTIQLAGNMENFFRKLANLLPENGAPDIGAIQKVYQEHDSAIVGPQV